jgi:phosphoribosylformylglycinamidine synthase
MARRASRTDRRDKQEPPKVIKARVTVTLKNGVLDPQGKAIEGALGAIGFDGVGSVRQGKVFDIELETSDREKAESDLKTMCERLLANTVIENYSVAIV